MPEELEHPKEEVQLVIFKLENEEYGVEIHEVREIIKRGQITHIPNAPAFVEGIINLRGKIVVVINLLKRFGTFEEAAHKGTHLIISEVNGNNFGILVDEVSEVLRIPKEDIKKAPSIIASKIHSDYLRGVGIIGERLLILLDLPKVLSEKEMVEMGELTKEMKAKAEEERRREKAKKKPKITDEEIERRFKERFEKQAEKPKEKTRALEKPAKPKEESEKEEKHSLKDIKSL